MTQKKAFDATNLNFWARLFIFVLSVLALIGVHFPDTPTDTAISITTSLSSGGFISVLGVLAVSVFMPVYNLIRTKPKITLASIIGSPNFWIYFGSFVFGLAVMTGIHIPDGTAEQLVGAAFAKDWSALFSIALANIVDPIVRYFIDKKNAQSVLSGT